MASSEKSSQREKQSSGLGPEDPARGDEVKRGDDADPTRCPRTTALRRISALPVRDKDVVWIGPREKSFDTDVYCDQKKIALTTVVR